MKNKFLALTLTGMLALSLVACGSKEEAPESNSESVVSEESSSEAEEAAPEENAAEPEEAEASSTTLDDILNSDEMKQALDLVNSQLESTGMTMNFVADGNVLVYEYSLPDEDTYNNLTEADAKTAFDQSVESQKSQMQSLFSQFESEYGVTLDGIRVVFNKADGTTIYSVDITEE